MKKFINTITIFILISTVLAFAGEGEKYQSKDGHISFFSHTVAEDITAHNYKSVSNIDPQTGEVVFSIPMQAFEFEKSLMQKHFNSDKFLDTKTYPKAKLKGKITNLKDIDFTKNGTYTANVSGALELHGVTKNINETGTITVKDGVVNVKSKMSIRLADYGIAFEKGKPSTNIAETVEVTIDANHQKVAS